MDILVKVAACLEQAELLVKTANDGVQPAMEARLEGAEKVLRDLQLSDAKSIRERVVIRLLWEVADLSKEMRKVSYHPRRMGSILARMEYLELGAQSLLAGRPLVDLTTNKEVWWSHLQMRDRLKAAIIAAFKRDSDKLSGLTQGWPAANFELAPVLEELLSFLEGGEENSPEATELLDELYEAFVLVDEEK